MELCSAVVLYLFIATTFVRSDQCYAHDFGWKGNNVKALNDCAFLKNTSTIYLEELANLPGCVKSLRVNFEDSNQDIKQAGPYNSPEKEIHIGSSLPNKCLIQDVKITVHCDCIGSRLYETRFKLNPMMCYELKRELNFYYQ